MKTHLLSIGDELLIGQTINTNVAAIATYLINLGIEVSKTSVVGDVLEDIIEEIDTVIKKNDLVIITGGLGPTHDDITKVALLKYFQTELVLHEETLRRIEERFARLNRIVSKLNEGQAYIPANAEAIPNDAGTAPGMWFETNGKYILCMPGVPHEMELMLREYIIPRLLKLLHNERIVKRVTLMTTGIAESTLFERLGDIEQILNGGKLAFLPDPFGVKMRITVAGEREDDVNNKLIDIEQKIRAIVGRYIYGKNNEQLPQVVGRMLKERQLKIAVAESCTGGYISHLFTNYSGCSEYFERGLISYSNAAKVELLHVDEDTLSKYGAVSLDVAMQMAAGIKSTSGADIGISVTGIMGPTGGSPEKPIGTVYIGICDNQVCTAKKFQFADDRIVNKKRTAQAAFDMIRRHILGIQYES